MNNLTNLEYIKSLFHQFNLKPKHYLGQNFLIDEDALAEIVAAADLKKTDTVLEVGPGIGTLTLELAKHAGEVIAVEKDEKFCAVLSSSLHNAELGSASQVRDPESSSGLRKVKIINQDILRFNLEIEIPGPYKVVANIPYYLTSHLVQFFLRQKNKPKLLVLMVQKEVGERVVAGPGELSILGISVQVFADVEIVQKHSLSPSPLRVPRVERGSNLRSPITSPSPRLGDGPFIIPRTSFWPKPKVDSVILRIEPKNKFPQIIDQKLFFRLIKVAFAGKRKQIHNTLANGLYLSKEKVLELLKKSKINPKARPQDLSIAQWITLYKQCKAMVSLNLSSS